MSPGWVIPPHPLSKGYTMPWRMGQGDLSFAEAHGDHKVRKYLQLAESSGIQSPTTLRAKDQTLRHSDWNAILTQRLKTVEISWSEMTAEIEHYQKTHLKRLDGWMIRFRLWCVWRGEIFAYKTCTLLLWFHTVMAPVHCWICGFIPSYAHDKARGIGKIDSKCQVLFINAYK